MFTVIKGKKEETEKELREKKEKRRNAYFRSFAKRVISEKYEDKLLAILYGIKYINLYDFNTEMTYMDFKNLFSFIHMIKNLLRRVKIKDLMNIFPIIKEYDGKKYECKDYFSTIEYLKTININDYMKDNLDDFLWNYYNHDLMNFSIKELLILDRLRKLEGDRGLMEEFTDMLGLDTYTINEKEGYIYNRRTMKTEPLKKARPSGFKVIDGKLNN